MPVEVICPAPLARPRRVSKGWPAIACALAFCCTRLTPVKTPSSELSQPVALAPVGQVVPDHPLPGLAEAAPQLRPLELLGGCVKYPVCQPLPALPEPVPQGSPLVVMSGAAELEMGSLPPKALRS